MQLRLLALLSLLVSTVVRAAEPTVEFVENPGALSPTRTLELRFSHDMIASPDVGKPVDESPLEIVPVVAGKWTWQSMRSGVFIPAEPWPLGTTVQVRLRDGLKALTGEGMPAEWQRTLDMPAFAVQAWSNLSYRGETDASAEPEIALLFNAEIDPQEATANLRFARAGGPTIPVTVEGTTTKRPGLTWFSKWETSSGRSLLTWAERFKTDAMPGGLRPNQLFIKPAKPLPVGENWRLVVAAGLPAKGGMYQTVNPLEVPIGTVKPFDIRELEATNYLNEGKRIRIAFSKSLRSELDTAALRRWITITPEPAELKATVEGGRVEYSGEFRREQSYRVAVEPGIPSSEPFVLSKGQIQELAFEPIAPRLYFESYETHQMRAGERKFHLLAVNVPKIKVSAKLFTGTGIPVALRGYEAYYEPPKGRDDEYHARVEVEKLPGQMIWQQVIDGTSDTDEQQEVAIDWTKILGPNRAGVVFLTAEQVDPPAGQDGRPGAQTIVQLTDIGAVWKRAPGETFVHTFSLKTGKALGRAKLRLMNNKDKTLASAVADEHGIARLPQVAEARWLFVETQGDSHVIEFRNGMNYVDLARVDVQFSEDEESPSADALHAFLFTERDVYRPGETAHLKGILRDWRPGQKALPAGLKLKLSVWDARDREFITRTVTMNSLGSFAEDLEMPQAPLGFYRAELRLIGENAPENPIASKEFQVEEFKPNTFEIVIGEGPKVPGPAELALPVSAKYYMGKALSKAQLTWSVSAHDVAFTAAEFEDFDFTDAISNYRLREHLDRRGGVSFQGKADLDEQGGTKLEASIPLNVKAPQPREVSVLCEITDLNQQTVSESQSFTLHSSDFYLGLRQFRSLLHVGEPIPIETVAVRTDGTPTPEPVKYEAVLTRIDWQNNRVEGADNSNEYRNEPEFKLVTRQAMTTAAVTKDGDRYVLAGSKPEQALVPDQPGEYLLELTAKDAAGRSVVTTTSFQVYGVGATAWDYRNPFQVEMVPEKDEYLSGETARILVKTPISGEALVTVEREKVLRSFTVRLEGNAPVVEIPLLPGDAPNVYIGVMLLRGAEGSPRKHKAPEYRVGYCELSVSRPDAQLTVYVKPGAKAYQPGQEVSITAEVLDHEGKPVRDAEVTLFAVDEGVLSLTGYETPDPFTFFNEPRPLTVSTALTLPSLLKEDPAERDFANKGYLIGGGGEDMALRKNFLPCAFWNATLKTDPEGKIAAMFLAPDSLTRYRVMAVVQTAKDQFGNGESEFEVNKPVMLEPALPRFANVGDKLALRAVLHNTTDLAGEAEVRVTFDGSVKAETTTQTLALGAKASASLDFPVQFLETGTGVWKWTVRFTSGETVHRDAVQTKLKVAYPAPLLRHVKTMRVEGPVANLLDGVDPQLLEGKGFVRVSFTNSRAIELQEALNQLLHYPYGCVEQTTSSTLPWLTLRKLRNQLPSMQRTDEDVAKAINHGINRILAMQTDSGGLAYWPGDSRPMLWGSAYGSIALTLAKEAGQAVPQEDYDRLMKYMSDELRGTAELKEHGALRERCMVVYALALAGRAEPAYHTLLFEKRDLLSDDDTALLALAIAESKGPAPMIEQLLANGKRTAEETWFWSPARSIAVQLLTWSRYKTNSPRTEALAAELFGERRDGHWSTTQGNAWSLMAMADYLTRTERENKSTTGKLKWADQNVSFALAAKPETKSQTFAMSPAVAHAPLALTSSASKNGKLYTEVSVEAYPPLREQPAQDRGYSLGRRYSKIEDDGTLTEAKDLRVGDRILVTLTMDVRERATYVAVEDPLPAVFEAVNPNFKTQEMRGAEQLGNDWMSDYRELREDRALFFADSVFPGRYVIRYLARVAAAGEATAPCAKIEEMYHPERFGLTDSQKISALPLK